MQPETIIKSKARVKAFAEVFTPSHLVKQMLNQLDELNYQSAVTYLDPSCGNGNFLVEVLRRKIEKVREDYTGKELAEWLVFDCLASVYGVDIQADNVEECRDRLFHLAFSQLSQILGINPVPFVSIFREVLEKNIRVGDTLKGDFLICSHSRKGNQWTVGIYKFSDLLESNAQPQLSYTTHLPVVEFGEEGYAA